MKKKIRIKCHRGWIGYPGSTIQQNYAEDLRHGFLLWDIKDRDSFDVRFCELPNPRPFITIEWQGSVESTVTAARFHPTAARFRIKHKDVLTQKEVAQLTAVLHNELKATEVTLKSERQVNRDVISTGATTLAKEDLRNPEVLMQLLRDYHRETSVTDDEWQAVRDQLIIYLQQVLADDDVIRNTKWSSRHLAFDNTFNYGSGNVINLERLQGIIGIFGPNRAGKSSIVGTFLYSLFNTTDRGNIKNLHVVNMRHPYCYTKNIVNVNSINYVIERQTTKYETRKGQIYAGTKLNLFMINESGEAIDLVGEQRNDTEKVIRKLIGAPEDCLLTSVAAQDDVKSFINQGTTKRRKDLSRFLDLDIFDRMYEQAKLDVNTNKGALRQLPDRDWQVLDDGYERTLVDRTLKIEERNNSLHEIMLELHDVRTQLAVFKDFNPVTQMQIDQQRVRVSSLESTMMIIRSDLSNLRQQIAERAEKIKKIEIVLQENDLLALKKRLGELRSLETSLEVIRHVHEKDVVTLKQQERSLKILDEVPCGDSYPGCKFIKDAFKQKDKIILQRDKVAHALERMQKTEASFIEAATGDLPGQISKLEQLRTLSVTLTNELVRLDASRDRKEHELEMAIVRYEEATCRFGELEEALRNEENVEAVSLRNRLDTLQRSVKRLDEEKLAFAAEVGRVQSDRAKTDVDKKCRHDVLQLMKAHELIANGFSRRGIPSQIVVSQLPIINAEIAKILSGIVNFSIEMEQDDDNDSMEVYIDYGDSRRVIELASGMEKTLAAIAIRVALINITSLPKTDMLIIDEAFGPLDPAGVEACNRLLMSLKRYFRAIIVITHVEGVKDVADHVIEISNVEKDAKVVCSYHDINNHIQDVKNVDD